MIKRYDLINVPCHGGWNSYDELQEVEDGGWVRYEDHVAEVGRISTELHLAVLRIATRNALPGLLAELCTLRARVAELERDARIGSVVRAAVGDDVGLMHSMSLWQREPVRDRVADAIADALRAEEPEPIYDVGMDDGLEREEVEVCGARCGRGCGDD